MFRTCPKSQVLIIERYIRIDTSTYYFELVRYFFEAISWEYEGTESTSRSEKYKIELYRKCQDA